MSSLETVGRTVEEAVSLALDKLQISRDEAEIEVLEEPGKKLLGLLGGRQARVRVTRRRSPAAEVGNFLEEVAGAMGLKVTVTSRDEGSYLAVEIEGDELGVLIGRRGETLNALQYLANIVATRKGGEHPSIVLDAGGYRKRREESLTRLAHKVSERVRRTGARVALEPMSPHERRIIHMVLQGQPDVYTFSEGEEPYRRVVVCLKK